METGSQFFDPAIYLVRRIQITRALVDGPGTRADGCNKKLSGLNQTLQCIKDEPELHTAAIKKQIELIMNLAQQYIDGLTSKDRIRGSPDNICSRLNMAMEDLNTGVLGTHVGVSGTAQRGFTVHSATVQRVDRNVYEQLGERLSIATHLERRGLGEGDVRIPLTDDDARALNLVEHASWIDNEADDSSDLWQTDIVERESRVSVERLYKGNKAFRGSMLFQGKADAEGIATIYRARHGK